MKTILTTTGGTLIKTTAGNLVLHATTPINPQRIWIVYPYSIQDAVNACMGHRLNAGHLIDHTDTHAIYKIDNVGYIITSETSIILGDFFTTLAGARASIGKKVA